MNELNFFDNYNLNAITKEIVPQASFFRDRYFPTGAEDLFAADKVLTEYQKGDRRMACFVAPRIGDIPVEREGYAIHEYQPAFIAPSRVMTVDDLSKRGFGEALYPGSTPAERAARLLLGDQSFLDQRIARREEWMAVQTMIDNACTMQEYIDAKTVGDVRYVKFFDDSSDHTYTVSPSHKWDTVDGNVIADVRNMCKMLTRRGLPAADLVLGSASAEAILANEELRERIKTFSGINAGQITQVAYPGVTNMGRLNFDGHTLDLFCVDESYEADNGTDTPYFPATSAMVTAPGCGHLMYAQITQIDYGRTDFRTYVAKRVPKLVVDQEHDIRKLRLGTRPLAAPRNYCPYIYAANVCGA